MTTSAKNHDPKGHLARPTRLGIVVRQRTLAMVRAHALSDVPNEVGGLLLGTYCWTDARHNVVAIAAVPATQAVGGPFSLNLSVGAWADMLRRIDMHPEYRDDKMWSVIGWYHTHPGLGVSLSRQDLWIHENFFTSSRHVALILDPIQDADGFYGWEGNPATVIRCQNNHVVIVDDGDLDTYLPNEVPRFRQRALPDAIV